MDEIAKKVQSSIDQKNSSSSVISLKLYNRLKNTSNLTAEQADQVEDFEMVIYEQRKKVTTYFRKINDRQDNFRVNAKMLTTKFLERFKEINGVAFNDKGAHDLTPLIYYFAKDKRFFDCDNLLSDTSIPSFDKGLLIIGNYGSGKSACMNTFQSLFQHTPLAFSKYNTNKIVDSFETYKDMEARGAYMARLKLSEAYFDDVKTEKEASSYGKHNLMKTIIEERYSKKVKTFITCNYREGNESREDPWDALAEFSDKYGPRVYDRLFEMFNIIQFNGKSFRV